MRHSATASAAWQEPGLRPNAARFDSEARFPEESLHAFKELGLVSLAFPENDGGQGGDVLSQVIALEGNWSGLRNVLANADGDLGWLGADLQARIPKTSR